MAHKNTKYEVGQRVEIVMATKLFTDPLIGKQGTIVGVNQFIGEVLVDHDGHQYWHEFKGIKLLEVNNNEVK